MSEQGTTKDQLPEHLQDWRKVLKRGRRINEAMDLIRGEFGVFNGAVKIVNLEDKVAELEAKCERLIQTAMARVDVR